MTGQSRLSFKDERLHVTRNSLNLQRLPANYCFSTGSFALGTQVLINLLLLCEEQKEQRFFRTWGQYIILRNSFQWNFFFLSQQQILSWWAFDQCDDLLGDILHCVLNAILQGEHVQIPWSRCWSQVMKWWVQDRFSNEIEHLPVWIFKSPKPANLTSFLKKSKFLFSFDKYS